MTAAVDVDLAASILAMWQFVHGQLQDQRPKLGRIDAQVREVFASNAGTWHSLAHPACQMLAGDVSETYIDQLGGLVSNKAAEGMAAGMALLLGRGWNPEVAWQQTLIGFGLDARRLRGLLGGVMPTPNASGAGVAPSPLARTAVRTTLAYAETLARTEIQAWDNAREGIAKAGYDPQERRDSDGKWVRGAAGKPVKERVEERDPLAGLTVAEETPPQANPFDAPRANPFAAAAGNPFATTPRANPFATAANPFATAGNPFAEARAARTAPNPFDTAAAENPFAEGPKRQAYVYFLTKQPGDVEPEEVRDDPRERHTEKHYIPLADLQAYYDTRGGDFGNTGPAFVEPIDFASISAQTNDTRFGTQRATDIWDVDGARRPYVDPGVWNDLSDTAHDLWTTALMHVPQVLQQMTTEDIKTFGEWAGFGDEESVDPIKAQILKDATKFHGGSKTHDYDGSAVEALCDYAVWYKPQVVTEVGSQILLTGDDLPASGKHEQLMNQGVDVVRNAREWRTWQDKFQALRSAPIPSVISFPNGFTPQDANDPSDLTGTYMPSWVKYRSALGEVGGAAPPGVIGVREIKVRPDRRV